MRELTLTEIGVISGGVEAECQETSLRSEFWSSFMYSSGFASGIFWSPVMPLIMGTVSLVAFVGNVAVSAITGLGQGTAYAASSAYGYVANKVSN